MEKLCRLSLVFFIINIIIFIFCIVFYAKKKEDKPIDDSDWNGDLDELKILLHKFLKTEQEKIEIVLGRNNMQNNASINKAGFCFVTNKSIYFMGKIRQKYLFLSWKSVIEKQMDLKKLSGISQKTVCPKCAELLLGYTTFMAGYLARIWIIIIQEDIGLGEFDDLTAGWLMLTTLCMIIMVLPMLISSIFILYTKRETVIDIQFETLLTMRFPITQLGVRELRAFYDYMKIIEKYVKRMKNRAQFLDPAEDNLTVKSLNELADLYEKKLISQSEFERIKHEIISCK